MPPSSTWVVKLGGAMMAAPELRRWLDACAAVGAGARCVIVPGGGAVADAVRALQARWGFDEQLAHELALEAMRMNARVLRALAPALPMWDESGEVSAGSGGDAGAAGGEAPAGACIWSPPRPFAPAALPADWSATSDSIALWLAQRIGASTLCLVKSLAAGALAPATADQLAGAGVIDSHFPALLRRQPLPVRVVAKSQYMEFARAGAGGVPYGVPVS